MNRVESRSLDQPFRSAAVLIAFYNRGARGDSLGELHPYAAGTDWAPV